MRSAPIKSTHPTFIFKQDGTNNIFVVLGFGSVPDKTELMDPINKDNITRFASNLTPYLSGNYTMILCGHSAGIVNAFFIGDILKNCVIDNAFMVNKLDMLITDDQANINNFNIDDKLKNLEEDNEYYRQMLDENTQNFNKSRKSIDTMIESCPTKNEIIKLIEQLNLENCDEYMNTWKEIYPSKSLRKPSEAPKKLTKYQNTIFRKIYDLLDKCEKRVDILARVYHMCNNKHNIHQNNQELQNNSPPNGTNYINLTTEFEKNLINKKENIEKLKQFAMNVLNKTINLNNVFICGSAGYPCFGDKLINYDALKKFYQNRVLHFRLPTIFLKNY